MLFTTTEHVESLAEFLGSLRETIQHTLTELIAEQHGVKPCFSLDEQYRHMLEEHERTSHITIYQALLHNDFQINQVFSRLGEKAHMRTANI